MRQPFGCNKLVQYSAVTLLALGIGACDETTTETQTRLRTPAPQLAVVLPTQVQELASVCVNGPTGSYSFTASEVDNSNIATLTQGAAFNLLQDQCVVVATTFSPPPSFGNDATITVGNVATPLNVGLDSVTKIIAVFARRSDLIPTTVTTTQETGPSSSFALGPEIGAILVFNFSPRPPQGGQGCTPGYWKQSQHFGNWTAPYSPYGAGTQFSAVFANAFPGMTLLQVLGQGGGGLKALGRHTVAALLNAASPNVASGYTTGQVIAAFNAAFASGNYTALHDEFEDANEQGCPLGRNP